MKKKNLNAICVHAGTLKDRQFHGINSPVVTSSPFRFLDTPSNVYPRYFNTPNQEAVAEKLCKLEGGEAGLVFSSGMAAIAAVISGLLKQGDHAVFQEDIYGGTLHFVTTELIRQGISYTLVNSYEPERFEQAIQKNTKLIYLETPSNPLLKIIDLESIQYIAHKHSIITAIDNTFASPINQTPIDLGIDVVIHSGTKYLGGHSDLSFGAVITSQTLKDTIYPRAVNYGGNLNGWDLHLIERSLKTLNLRVKQQTHNAQHIAERLQEIPSVQKVNYPGLNSHPDHKLARRQMHGFGAMLSFEVDQMIEPRKFFTRLNMVVPALSLGGVETLICQPSTASHSKLTPEQRAKAGITDQLFRLSVGIEEPEEILSDLLQALE